MTNHSALLTLERDRTESASEAVVRALSTATGVDPTAFTPLYESIEPDALDQLFTGNPTDTGIHERSIQFTHADHVVVCRDSEVSIFAECSACTA